MVDASIVAQSTTTRRDTKATNNKADVPVSPKVAKLTKETKAANELAAQLTKETKAANELAAQLTAEKAKANKCSTKATKDLEALQLKLDKSESALLNAKNENTLLLKEKKEERKNHQGGSKDPQGQVVQLQELIEAREASLRERANELKLEKRAHTLTSSKVTSLDKAAGKHADRLAKQTDDHKKQLTQMETRTDTLGKEIAAEKAQVASLTGQLQMAQTESTRMSSQLTEADFQVKKFQGLYKEVSEKNVGLGAQSQGNESNASKLRDEVFTLTSQVNELASQVRNYENSVTPRLQGQLAQGAITENKLNETVSGLHSQVGEFRTQVVELKNLNKKLTKREEKNKGEVAQVIFEKNEALGKVQELARTAKTLKKQVILDKKISDKELKVQIKAKLQTKESNRVKIYESRISELEKKLASKKAKAAERKRQSMQGMQEFENVQTPKFRKLSQVSPVGPGSSFRGFRTNLLSPVPRMGSLMEPSSSVAYGLDEKQVIRNCVPSLEPAM